MDRSAYEKLLLVPVNSLCNTTETHRICNPMQSSTLLVLKILVYLLQNRNVIVSISYCCRRRLCPTTDMSNGSPVVHIVV